jgi:hypothetical protein
MPFDISRNDRPDDRANVTIYDHLIGKSRHTIFSRGSLIRSQPENTTIMPAQRTPERILSSLSVSFADEVTTHEIPPFDQLTKNMYHYTRSDFRRFKIAEQFRMERAIARHTTKLIKKSEVTMRTHLQQVDVVQKVEEHLLVDLQQVDALQKVEDHLLVTPAEDFCMPKCNTVNMGPITLSLPEDILFDSAIAA